MTLRQWDRLTQDIDVDVLVDVSDGVGGVAAVVAGVSLLQIADGDPFGSDDPVGVVRSFVDRPAVMDPLDLGAGDTIGLTLEDDGLTLGGSLDLRLSQEPRLGEDLEVNGVRLGEADTVGGFAGVLAGVLEVDVLDDERLAVVVVGSSAPRKSTTLLAPTDLRKWGAWSGKAVSH